MANKCFGSCHLLVVKPRSEHRAKFHKHISFCQQFICLNQLQPSVKPSQLRVKGCTPGNQWYVKWARIWLVISSLAGKFLAWPVCIAGFYKLCREKTPSCSRFGLHRLPAAAAFISHYPNAPSTSCHVQLAAESITIKQGAGQQWLCATFFGRQCSSYEIEFFWFSTSNKGMKTALIIHFF